MLDVPFFYFINKLLPHTDKTSLTKGKEGFLLLYVQKSQRHECVASWGPKHLSIVCRKRGSTEIILYKISSIVSNQNILYSSKLYFNWDSAVRRQTDAFLGFIKLKFVQFTMKERKIIIFVVFNHLISPKATKCNLYCS